MTTSISLDQFLKTIQSHKTQVESHNYVKNHQTPIAVLMEPLVPNPCTRQNVQVFFRDNDYVINDRLADTISTLVKDLRTKRARNIRSH